MKEIPLTKGAVATVDDEDYEWLMQWKWMLSTGGYAVRGRRVNKKNRFLAMHREIIKTPPDMITDHINHNKLDNRKCNLRICNKRQNEQNKPKFRGKTSKYKGVNYYPRYNKWVTRVYVNSKAVFHHYYETEKEAALAYNEAARQIFGEFACLNEVI